MLKIFATALFTSLAGLVPAQAGTYGNADAPIQSVQTLDVQRYLGLWYEIARFPNRFERDCVAVTAEYAQQDDATISVTNTCRKLEFDGDVEVAQGSARIEAPGQLSVNFVWFLPFIRGDYWVLYVADDYSLAVVGEPGRDYGWILARSPQISDATYAHALSVLEANGYDPALIELVPQPDQ